MIADHINNSGVVRSIISLNNLVQNETKEILGTFPINYLEYSILIYVSQNLVTQYKISKEYNMSVQRINQFMTNLEKNELVFKKEIKTNGRMAKEIFITQKGKKIIKKINDEVNKRVERLEIKAEMLNSLKKMLILFKEDFSQKTK
ncbi:MAG: hypothetical protein ACRCXY_07905 [Fusobacteriaceae bacterium]